MIPEEACVDRSDERFFHPMMDLDESLFHHKFGSEWVDPREERERGQNQARAAHWRTARLVVAWFDALLSSEQVTRRLMLRNWIKRAWNRLQQLVGMNDDMYAAYALDCLLSHMPSMVRGTYDIDTLF